ncbi:MAG: hypothetical protein LBB74_03155, partial [Chitinispirillales bacterium]|nr:hypothetical protein [Chitinispirillales bacterium]
MNGITVKEAAGLLGMDEQAVYAKYSALGALFGQGAGRLRLSSLPPDVQARFRGTPAPQCGPEPAPSEPSPAAPLALDAASSLTAEAYVKAPDH